MSLDSSNSKQRSINSTSSNNQSNTSNSKKRKSNQKTLGMAWGANSLSGSRPSFRSSPFSDFGSYMAVKNKKLQNQFDAQASNSSRSDSYTKPIFDGVSIFVDGFTIPSSQELRQYMLNYGGRFENYFSRHRVTHIICSNLPDSKIKNLRSFSSGLPVVKPMWILDSVAANKLLSWVPYQLNQLANNQPTLSSFFTPKSKPADEGAFTNPICEVKHETGLLCLKDASKDASFSEAGNSFEWRKQATEEHNKLMCENSNKTLIDEPSNRYSEEPKEVEVLEPTNLQEDDESLANNRHQSCPEQSSASVSSHCFDNRGIRGSPRSSVIGPSKQRHSTLKDPNFVENYFKNSRLHFIGTWRNRYRNRFPSLSNGWTKSTNSDVSAGTQKTPIIHIDMDCFFVSVVIRSHPELNDKPVAVCHSYNPKGTAEISSANYSARDYGIKAGMFVRDAKGLCPQLVILPYNFEAYEEVADKFYNILHKHCNRVQAVSCDEAFLDVTDLEGRDPQLLASAIRKEIYEATGCSASAGIAKNMLMARLATSTAKPNGQCYIHPERVDEYLDPLPLKALPGIGHVLAEKLKNKNVQTCGQLRLISKDSLQKDFGIKTGEMLWNYSRGVDNRLVGMIQESKSVGAEVNWGVRFRDFQHAQHFLLDLCKEVSLRLQGCGVQGRTFTLKIKKRRKDAGEPTKFMGCGDCENLSHSITVSIATDDIEVLQRITKQLFGSFHIDVKDIRGVGLQVSRLESADTSRQAPERNSLKSWLMSASESSKEQFDINSIAKECMGTDSEGKNMDGNSSVLHNASVENSVHGINKPSNGEGCSNQNSSVPPLCDLDMGVVESLPSELLSEINEIYGGKLFELITKRKVRGDNSSRSLCFIPPEPALEVEAETSHNSDPVSLSRPAVEMRDEQPILQELQTVPDSGARSNSVAISTAGLENNDLVPSSLSQLDTSVLQQLPEELRADIFEALPAHRIQETSAMGPKTDNERHPLGIKSAADNQPGSTGTGLSNNLWIGNPPLWVDKFKVSNLPILKFVADMYYKANSPESLSSILQCTLAESLHPLDSTCDAWNEAIHSFNELLMSYVKLKIVVDIEEIYVCFRLLRRLSTKSEFFLEVYNLTFPHLQASVDENYGGTLNIHRHN
ncbi:DNA repair protein REV1 [Hibiscus syriacus]|uniref:DNA repair protein REV1 n=1 Tax=Hibiscus syriacus TaxID=106335 RepID=A0A6A3A325_HIBSY|nr:DNA repair protein REV1 isoform X2 [Hibiscus syriacus]KAE8698588.1 DNA repair protein REV1 [Hibiscus syriacus]